MFELNPAVNKAISDIERLDTVHKQFIESFISSNEPHGRIGKITASVSKITCFCLNHTATAEPRHVAINSEITAIEYNFVVLSKNREISVLRLFLHSGGIITSDVEGDNKVCDFNNRYIKNYMLNELSVALLKSPVFDYAPAK